MQKICKWVSTALESARMEIGKGLEEDETLQQTALRRKLGFFNWTCYAIRWIGKRNHAGIRRWKEESTTKKKWMDEICHETTGVKLVELRDVTTARRHWRRLVKTIVRAQRVDGTR